jgi:hypothetical protein
LFSFLRHLNSLINILGLSDENRQLVFYSEGKNYWVHLEGLVEQVLATSDVNICFLTSSTDDPGLYFEHANFRSYEIGDGFARDWIFANIDAAVMVMSTPDLHQYQVKKSRHDVHYVYVQHSLVSLHMVYRPKAFEHYNTIFCAGPHHVLEMRAVEKLYGFPQKKLVEHGYARLDSILAHAASSSGPAENKRPLHILIAPSWGANATIELGIAHGIVANLLQRGFKVTLRPHPQTLKFAATQVDAINSSFCDHPLFSFEDNVAGQDSLHASDMMISDWSGAALDYALGLKKPVLFIDVPRKINDPSYDKLNIEPIESSIRDKIGIVVAPDCTELPIEQCMMIDNSCLDMDGLVFNVSRSNEVGARAILELLD